MIVHGGCLALWSPGGWCGLLIQGESGSGKSDLALRLMDLGFRLVSDDRTRLWRSAGRLFAACPPPIAGLIEARGVGVMAVDSVSHAEVVLAMRCEAAVERLPDPEAEDFCGGAVPLVRLDALQASTAAKLFRLTASLGAGSQGAYLASAATPRAGVPVKVQR